MATRNIGDWDKGLRLFVVAMAALPVFSRPERDGLTWLLLIALFYLLITALASHCFIYDVFHLSTYDDHLKENKK